MSSLSKSADDPFSSSMEVVRRILDTNKNPVEQADKIDHTYQDKYSLVEFLTNTGIAAILNVLEELDGFNGDVLKQLIVAVQSQNRSMTLRLAVEEDCEFVKEGTRTIERPRSELTVEKVVTETGNGTPASTTSQQAFTHMIVEEVKEFYWKAGLRHSLVLFAGTDPSSGVVLGQRTGTTQLVTAMNKAPYLPTTRAPIDINLSWLFRQINPDSLECSFAIDRETAKTPSRNKQIEEALDFIRNLQRWSSGCLGYFQHKVKRELFHSQMEESPADWLVKINAKNVFVPIIPLFQEYDRGNTVETTENSHQGNESSGLLSLPVPSPGSPLLPRKDTAAFLEEQCRSLKGVLLEVDRILPDPNDQAQLISRYEGKLVLLSSHILDLTAAWYAGITYVEAMLRSQLIQAIGKEVQPSDFCDFIKFHNQRTFGKAYSPKSFCHAVRQPNQYPDGVVSIIRGSSLKDPIETFSRRIPRDSLVAPISIPLNASTTVDFAGDQYLHGWLETHFASNSRCLPSRSLLNISARARQFSCFMLMTGSISGPNEFTPKDAIIIQIKDEVLIPLLTTSLPSAKEFRDAIKSLSPEQSQFAKSLRAMQLDSSVFGLCVIQVKPQMEALLDLPPNSLTKEIQLTQDLLSLFVEHQIPPSLVSYDGDMDATPNEKVTAVKQHVKGVLEVIDGMKEKQYQDETKKADLQQSINKANQFKIPQPGIFGSSGGVSRAFGSSQAVPFGAPRPSPFGAAAALAPGGFAAAAAVAPAPGGFGGAAGSSTPQQESTFGYATEEGFDTLQDQFSDLDLGETKGLEDDPTDFTAIPKHLDHIFESFDKDGALRTMTIKTGDQWVKTHQENLWRKANTTNLSEDDRKKETNRALDLLDALSRSGSLPVASGELHVMIGVQHSFEKNVMDTVIEENVNPIEKVDYSSLLISATVHKVDIPTLLADNVEPPSLALKDHQFPTLMLGGEKGESDDDNDGGGDAQF